MTEGLLASFLRLRGNAKSAPPGPARKAPAKNTSMKSTRAWLWILLLMLLHMAVYLHSASVVDTARDIYNAWNIAQLSNFPMEGPSLAGVLHLGPVWFYLLSVPLFFSSDWIGIALWAGLIAALKYPLAYHLGRLLAGQSYGLVFAGLLALPGWGIVSFLIINHVNAVETATLFAILCLAAWRSTGKPYWLMLLPPAVVLGVHAHPTVYVIGLIAIGVLVPDAYRGRIAWRWLLAGVVLGAFPVLPYVASQAAQGWPEWTTGSEYVVGQNMLYNLAGIPRLVRGILVDGPVAAYTVILNLGITGLVIAGLQVALFGAGMLAAVWIAFRPGMDGSLARILLAAWIVAVIGVALIREVTPYYMVLVLTPFSAGLAAHGLLALRKPARRILEWTVTAAAPALLALVLVRLAGIGTSGLLYIPGESLADVRRGDLTASEALAYFPARARAQLAAFLCAHDGPLTMHGYGSLVLEQSYALEARMRCGKDDLYLGGRTPGGHVIGVRRADAEALALTGGRDIGSLRIFTVARVVHPGNPVEVPAGDVYPPRPYVSGLPVTRAVDTPVDPEQWLVITNLYEHWMPADYEVRVDGRPVGPVLSTRSSGYFRCAACDPVSGGGWRIEITAPAPEFVEIVTFTPGR